MIEEDENAEQESGEELYEHYRILVDKGQQPLRIDKFLFNRINGASRNKIQQAAESESILVSGKAVKSNYKVKPFDEIVIVLPHPKEEYKVEPENIPLNIFFEDIRLTRIVHQSDHR